MIGTSPIRSTIFGFSVGAGTADVVSVLKGDFTNEHIMNIGILSELVTSFWIENFVIKMKV